MLLELLIRTGTIPSKRYLVGAPKYLRAFRLAFAAIFLALMVPSKLLGSAQEKREATVSFSVLKRGIEEHSARINSLKATIRSYNVGIKNGKVVWAEVAAKGSCRYELLWHGNYSSPADDPRSLIRIFNEKAFDFFKPYQMWYETTEKYTQRIYTNKILRHFFYESTGWWPAKDKSTPPKNPWGEPLFLPTILADERCRVRAEQEQIEGFWCHVIEIPNIVQLWIDSDHYVVRQRKELVDKARKAKDRDYGKLQVKHVLTDYRSVGNDVILPFKIRRYFYEKRPDTVHYIENYQINEIEDSLFKFDPQPGVMICNRDKDQIRQVPGGVEKLDTIATRAISHVAHSSVLEAKDRTLIPLSTIVVAFVLGFGTYQLIGFQFYSNRQ